ncbi:MAG: dephospho-CoA kinase [Armatimonadetes bacterium]|nr:dephospho-CoA kinase [Armatimonadota bacterium]
MIALAVVGPIASGKSTVLGLLRELGAETCSADDLAHELTAPGQPALEEIIAQFGGSYRREDGSLDRAALAELIFRSTDARERLEGILHPAILVRIGAWLTALRARPDPPPVAAVEVLRLPRHLRARETFDVVWLCNAPEALRLRRLIERDALPEDEARRRLAVQREQQVEDCDPDLVLDAGGTLEALAAQVRNAWSRLTDRSP